MIKFLKFLLALLTLLAAVLAAGVLLWQDKTAPRYIQIYNNAKDL